MHHHTRLLACAACNIHVVRLNLEVEWSIWLTRLVDLIHNIIKAALPSESERATFQESQPQSTIEYGTKRTESGRISFLSRPVLKERDSSLSLTGNQNALYPGRARKGERTNG